MSTADEVAGEAVERDVTAVGADRREVARAAGFAAAEAEVDAHHRAVPFVEDAVDVGVAIVHEDVAPAVRCHRDEIVRLADEDDEASRARELRVEALAVPFDAGRADAHAGRDAVAFIEDAVAVRVAVVDEHVVAPVAVAGNEVRRGALEDDVTSVAREAGEDARAVGLDPGAGDADPGDGLGGGLRGQEGAEETGKERGWGWIHGETR